MFVVEPGNGTVGYSLELLEKGFVVEPGNGTNESVFAFLSCWKKGLLSNPAMAPLSLLLFVVGLRVAHLALFLFAFPKVLPVEMTLCHPALAATGVAEAHSVWSASPNFEACSVSVVFSR